jgi:hypothetical protein
MRVRDEMIALRSERTAATELFEIGKWDFIDLRGQ